MMFSGLMAVFPLGFAVAAEEPDVIISRGIELITEQRTKAETQISLLEGLRADQDITHEEYAIAKTKYSEAQGAFNGWMDRLLYDLRQGQELDASPDYQQTLQGAAKKGDGFVTYVQLLFLGKEKRGAAQIAGPLAVFLQPLTDAGIAIWREVRDYLQVRQDRRERVLEEVKAQLVPLKWRNFDEVRADRARQ